MPDIGMNEFDKSNLVSPGNESRNTSVPKDTQFGRKGPESMFNYSVVDPSAELDPNEAAAIYNRRTQQSEEFMRGHGSVEVMRSTSRPEVAGHFFSRVLDRYESPESKEAFDRYSLKPYYGVLDERIRNMELTNGELTAMGIKKTATINGQVYELAGEPGFSLRTEVITEIQSRQSIMTDIIVQDGKGTLSDKEREENKIVKLRVIEEQVPREVVQFGTDSERQIIADGLKDVELDAMIREKAATIYWYGYVPNTAALDAIVEGYYFRLPKFSNTEFKKVFSQPDYRLSVLGSPENTVMGDGIDMAKSLLWLVTQSEHQGTMQEALNRPKFTDEIFAGMSQQEIERWVGKVGTWVKDDQRHQDSYKDDTRGPLTQFGDIYARGGKNKEKIVIASIKSFVAQKYQEKYGGTKKDAERFAENAFRQAYFYFKIGGLAAEEGEVGFKKVKTDTGIVDAPEFPTNAQDAANLLITPEGKAKADLLRDSFILEGDPMTDDLTKLMKFKKYRMKEFLKGNAAGPASTIAESRESVSNSLLRTASSVTEFGMRTFIDQWLGNPMKEIKNANGRVVATFEKEPSHKLRELPWDIGASLDEAVDMLGDGGLKEIEEELTSTMVASGNKEISDDAFSPTDTWHLYGLFNFLPGRKESSPSKAWYGTFYQEYVSPQDLNSYEIYKNKNKFYRIQLQNHVVTRGDFRKFEENLALEIGRKPSKNDIDSALKSIKKSEYDRNRELWLKGIIDAAPLEDWETIKIKYQKEIKIHGGTRNDEEPIINKIYRTAKECGFPIPSNFPPNAEVPR